MVTEYIYEVYLLIHYHGISEYLVFLNVDHGVVVVNNQLFPSIEALNKLCFLAITSSTIKG